MKELIVLEWNVWQQQDEETHKQRLQDRKNTKSSKLIPVLVMFRNSCECCTSKRGVVI